MLTPLELLARLAALIPPPPYPLVRYHGVLAPRIPWSVLLRRTFDVDVLECMTCHGHLRTVGAIDDPLAARALLEQLGLPRFGWAQMGPRPLTVRRTTHKTSVGEGGLGADGFVAVERDGVLLWLAFFDFSNPFEAVMLVDGQVEARSSHQCHWKFDIASPQLLSVTRAHEDEP